MTTSKAFASSTSAGEQQGRSSASPHSTPVAPPTLKLLKPDPVAAFQEHLAAIKDEKERSRLLNKVKMRAAVGSSSEAPAAKAIGRSAAELIDTVPEEPDWLIPGVMARTWMIKVAAREKTGKGTLIAYLLGKLERGEATVFGPATAPVRALVYTEEPQDSIREKVAHAGLRDAWIVYGYELAGETWPDKVTALVTRATELGAGVLFVDNISRAAGVEDEAGVELARAAETLGEAAKAEGLSVIIDHHHKKGAGKLDDKSRGGTALAGACDNNLEMVRVGDWSSRVRAISSRGRVSATIWEQSIALSDDGREYESVAGAQQPQSSKERSRLRVLSDAGDAGVTAGELASLLGVGDTTARRQLDEFTEKGWAAQVPDSCPARWASTGEGLRSDLDPTTGGLALS